MRLQVRELLWLTETLCLGITIQLLNELIKLLWQVSLEREVQE